MGGRAGNLQIGASLLVFGNDLDVCGTSVDGSLLSLTHLRQQLLEVRLEDLAELQSLVVDSLDVAEFLHQALEKNRSELRQIRPRILPLLVKSVLNCRLQ